MVQYGKTLKKSRRQGWEASYLDYKKLKRIVSELERYLEDRHTNRILQSISQATLSDDILNTNNDDIESTTNNGHNNGVVRRR